MIGFFRAAPRLHQGGPNLVGSFQVNFTNETNETEVRPSMIVLSLIHGHIWPLSEKVQPSGQPHKLEKIVSRTLPKEVLVSGSLGYNTMVGDF